MVYKGVGRVGGLSGCWQGFDNEGVVRMGKEAVAVWRAL